MELEESLHRQLPVLHGKVVLDDLPLVVLHLLARGAPVEEVELSAGEGAVPVEVHLVVDVGQDRLELGRQGDFAASAAGVCARYLDCSVLLIFSLTERSVSAIFQEERRLQEFRRKDVSLNFLANTYIA